jgi:hypothetical protein
MAFLNHQYSARVCISPEMSLHIYQANIFHSILHRSYMKLPTVFSYAVLAPMPRGM